MSKMLNFTATGTVGPPTGGFRMGGISIAAAANAGTAVLTEIVGTTTFTRCQLTTPANTTDALNITDQDNGVVFDGVLVLSTLTGAGVSVNIEEM